VIASSLGGSDHSDTDAWSGQVSQAVVIGRDQAAARRSRADGHPLPHATTKPVTVTVVTGAAAIAVMSRPVQAARYRAPAGQVGEDQEPEQQPAHSSAPSGSPCTSTRSPAPKATAARRTPGSAGGAHRYTMWS
jgi:hypothetical protein